MKKVSLQTLHNEYFENEWIVNHNHQKVKSLEFNIPAYTDHEIRMQQLERKACAEQVKTNIEAIKYGFYFIISIPAVYTLIWLIIKFAWLYSYAVRGF